MKSLPCRSLAMLFSMFLLLFGCGGGGGDGGGTTSPVVTVTTGTLQGKVVASSDSSPVANALVSVASLSARTDSGGNFTLNNVPESTRVVVRIEASNYVDGIVVSDVAAGTTTQTSARLASASAALSFNAGDAVTLSPAGSVAQVKWAANSLVNAVTGAAATGAATAIITPIDPARDPETMPGDYTVSDTVSLESFGAIKVVLKDASGARLNLKPGSTAEIRIPLASRSDSPPATIPLYYMDESTGRWVEEGQATLSGSSPNQYYQGTVSHFSFFNADFPMNATTVAGAVFVQGCVLDSAGAPAYRARVSATGLLYSGLSTATTTRNGGYRVAIRKNSRASIVAQTAAGTSNVILVGPSSTDINLSTCLVIATAPAAPGIVAQPANASVNEGAFAMMSVTASGTPGLSYQWKRNGVAIPGATGSAWVRYASAGDAGVYTVVVSNSLGSVTSNPATLTVVLPSPVVSSVAPATASVGQPTVFTVTGSALPLTAQLTIAGATCNAPANNTATGFGQICTLTGLSGARTISVLSASGGSVIDASQSVTATVVAPPVSAQLTDTGISATHCYGAGSDALVSCTDPAAIALNDRQDGMTGIDVASPSPTDGTLGLSYSEVPNPGGGNFARTECIKDNLTGLVWEGKPLTGTRDAALAMTNQGGGAATDTSGYVASVNNSALCGFSDWRLPTPVELQSLVDYSTTFPTESIDLNWLPNTDIRHNFWTSAILSGNSFNAWAINFRGGSVANFSRSSSAGVRLVRGAATTGQLTISLDGQEVTDNKTGLVWRRCLEGMSWSGSACTGSPLTLTHEGALQRAKAQAIATSVQWRLPNIKELSSLVDRTRNAPAIDGSAFPNAVSGLHWSSSPYVTVSSNAWAVDFTDGFAGGSDSRGGANYVRLVRVGP